CTDARVRSPGRATPEQSVPEVSIDDMVLPAADPEASGPVASGATGDRAKDDDRVAEPVRRVVEVEPDDAYDTAEAVVTHRLVYRVTLRIPQTRGTRAVRVPETAAELYI